MHIGLLLALLLGLLGGPAFARVVDQVPMDLEILAPLAIRLTLTPNSISFPDADPDQVPVVPAQEGAVMVVILFQGPVATLTAQALTHLESAQEKIDISNVGWETTSAGFLSGTLKLGAEVPVGRWVAGTRVIRGFLSFGLRNRWEHPPGKYQATVRFTATAY